jgi:hypothetical protein
MRQSTIDPEKTVVVAPFAASGLAATRMLAELAVERAVKRDVAGALAAIEDASVLIDVIEDQLEIARVNVVLGEAYLALRNADEAKRCFEAGFMFLLSAQDHEGCARAVLGIARALQLVGDSRARDAFQYAGLLQAEGHGQRDAVRAT